MHESGYDVSYSRYSVTYRDANGELVLGAEFDDDGVLVVHSTRWPDRLGWSASATRCVSSASITSTARNPRRRGTRCTTRPPRNR